MNNDVSQEVRKAYDNLASGMDTAYFYRNNRFINWHKQKEFERAISLMRKYCDLSKENNFLDAGCGDGEMIQRLFALEKLRFFGVDFSGDSLSIAKQRLQLMGADIGRVKFYQGDLGHMPFFSNNYFDIIYEFGVSCFFSNSLPVYREYLRVTKPGGILFLELTPRWSIGHLAYLFKPIPEDWSKKRGILKKLMFWKTAAYYHYYHFGRIRDFLDRTGYSYAILERSPIWFYYCEGIMQRLLNKLAFIWGERIFDTIDRAFKHLYRIPAGYFLVIKKIR